MVFTALVILLKTDVSSYNIYLSFVGCLLAELELYTYLTFLQILTLTVRSHYISLALPWHTPVQLSQDLGLQSKQIKIRRGKDRLG